MSDIGMKMCETSWLDC